MIIEVAGLGSVLVILVGLRLSPRPARIAAMATAPDRIKRSRNGRAGAIAAAALGVVAVAIAGGVFAGAACGIGAVLHRRVALIRRDRRRRRSIADHYPDFLDLVVLTVHAGCNPLQTFRSLAGAVEPQIDAALADLVQRVDRGARFVEALSALPEHLGPIARSLADSLALADRHGVPLAATLDRLSAEAHSHRRRNADTAARQLPVKLSFPLVTCTLPSFVLLTIVPLMAGTFSSLRSLTR